MKKQKEIQKQKMAIGYTRISSGEKKEKGVSLLLQRNKIKSYTKLKDLKLLKVVSDPGKSGYKLSNRAGMKELLKRVENKEISAVIVYKLDRLSRSLKDTLSLIFDVFEKNDVAFVSLTENFDTSTAMGKFVLSMFAALNEMMRNQVSERTKDALELLKEKGRYLGGSKFVAYGLRLTKNKVATMKDLKIEPSEMKNVREMRKLRKKNWTLAKIGSRFQKNKSSIKYILENPVYKKLGI